MKLIFFSLASGSSGNCYYLGTSEYGLLIEQWQLLLFGDV